MMKNKTLLKLISLALVISVIFAFAGCGKTEKEPEPTENIEEQAVTYTAKPGTVKKSETVYVNMDSFGKVKATIVSDWIHTDIPEVAVDDMSNLKDISNIKSSEKPVSNGGENIVWNMKTTDLYYRGESDATLPVSISIKYFLNDKEVKPENIAGQSGKVKIVVKMINNISTTKSIKGKSVKIYNPVAVIGGTILPEGQFQNVSISSGKIIGDGNKEIVMMVGMPGINETLGFDKIKSEDLGDLKFDDTFTITADAKEFELGNIYFAVLPISSLAKEFDIDNTVGDLTGALNQLKMLESALKTMDPNSVLTTLMQNPNKVIELTDAVNDAISLYKSNKVLIDIFSKYMTEDNMAAMQRFLTKMDSPEVQNFVKLMQTKEFQAFIKILPSLSGDMSTVGPMLSGLSSDLSEPEAKAALDNLPQTMSELNRIKGVIDSNKDTVNALTNVLSEDNIAIITSILDSADTTSLASKIKKYSALTDNADEIVAKLNAMLNYGSQYEIYSSAAGNMDTSVMFIYQTPSVSKPVEAKTAETVTENVPWYKKIFNK